MHILPLPFNPQKQPANAVQYVASPNDRGTLHSPVVLNQILSKHGPRQQSAFCVDPHPRR
jgi:hypothetical protein